MSTRGLLETQVAGPNPCASPSKARFRATWWRARPAISCRRHIANARIQARLRRLADAAGFTLPVICTPEELLENDNEQDD